MPDAATLVQRLQTILRSADVRAEDLPTDDVLRLLSAVGVEVDDSIDREVQLAVERIRRSVASGRRPDRALLEQAAQSLTSRIGTAVRTTGKAVMESYALARTATAAPEVTGGLSEWMWLAVMKGSCPSCEERHGAVRTLAQWETEGRPRSEVLYCGANCRCDLWPVQAAGSEVTLLDELPGGAASAAEAETVVTDLLVRLQDAGVLGAEVRVGREPLRREPFDIAGIVRTLFLGS